MRYPAMLCDAGNLRQSEGRGVRRVALAYSPSELQARTAPFLPVLGVQHLR